MKVFLNLLCVYHFLVYTIKIFTFAVRNRFKQLPYATDEEKKIIAKSINEMLTKLIQEESGDDDSIKIEDEVPSKKSRLSGTWNINCYNVFPVAL